MLIAAAERTCSLYSMGGYNHYALRHCLFEYKQQDKISCQVESIKRVISFWRRPFFSCNITDLLNSQGVVPAQGADVLHIVVWVIPVYSHSPLCHWRVQP